jgi:thymidylate synthase
MNTLDKKYQQLLSDIIAFGVEKKDRTGTGTISEFGHQIRHKMSEGFPLLTTKKMAWKQIVSELLWFLTGQTNISFLLKHNNHIWDGDAYKNFVNKVDSIWQKSAVGDLDDMIYDGLLIDGGDENGKWFARIPTKEEFIGRIKSDVEFAKQWGELGPIYGKQWRKWDGKNGRIDQIDDLVRELKTNPDSRRLMVSAWNVGELDQMVLPPCHYGFQIYTRELDETERVVLMDKKLGVTENLPAYYTEDEMVKHNIPKRAISLMWNQRSVDIFLGLPFNIASYGLLLHIIANEVNMIPDELIGNLGDTHLYLNHIEQAKEQISRDSFDLPILKTDAKMDGICCNVPDDFVLEGYQSHPAIKAPLSN